MSLRIILSNILNKNLKRTLNNFETNKRLIYNRGLIGNREVVGYGSNGSYSYWDTASYPFPAIRFREPTPEICALREKERGDWRNLTIEEKKCLYRASFCYTFAEFRASSPEWKGVTGCVLILLSLGIFLQFFIYRFLVYPQLPDTFTVEKRRAQYERQINMRVNPITGLGSRYDYEKNEFKPGYKW